MKHKFLLLYSWFVRTALFFFPDVPLIMRFRGWLYGLGMKSRGKDFQVTHDATIKDIENISVGSNCFIGNGSIVMGSGTITIEDMILIGPHVIIVSGNHMSDGTSYKGKISAGDIRLSYGSWVAGNCTIQKGAVLPPNSVLSANSLLNKKFDSPDSVYGGVPAKLLKTYSKNSD